MRGKPSPGHCRRSLGGLIPAYAGKTFPAMSRVRYIRAHPRVCGENTNDTISAALEGGSSPRVRGKPAAASRCFARLGLIPACAGKTRAARLSTSKHEAHPRVCGENLFTFAYKPFVTGSSPRGRGKREPGKPRDRRPRLIPACAGKTTTTSHPTFRSTAHPRACGENRVGHFGDNADRGSSPRMRGKRAASLPG